MWINCGDQDNIDRGRREGAGQMSQLVATLLKQGRDDDAFRAASDANERKRLAKELGIEVPCA